MSLEPIIKILVSLILGGIIGVEREKSGKAAGLRTHMLVAMAATAFTLIAKEANTFFQSTNYDPGRLTAQVVLGIGFIGAGVIIYSREHIHGVTTAAGLWVATAIGMLVGINAYALAVIVAILSFIILAYFRKIEDRIEKS